MDHRSIKPVGIRNYRFTGWKHAEKWTQYSGSHCARPHSPHARPRIWSHSFTGF